MAALLTLSPRPERPSPALACAFLSPCGLGKLVAGQTPAPLPGYAWEGGAPSCAAGAGSSWHQGPSQQAKLRATGKQGHSAFALRVTGRPGEDQLQRERTGTSQMLQGQGAGSRWILRGNSRHKTQWSLQMVRLHTHVRTHTRTPACTHARSHTRTHAHPADKFSLAAK